MIYVVVVFNLVLNQVGGVVVEALKLCIHPIVIETFEHNSQRFEDCDHMSMSQVVVCHVAVD